MDPFTILFGLAVFTGIMAYILWPRPEQENMRASELGDIRFPQATEGAPLPLIFGKVKMEGPNTLWYGDFLARPRWREISSLFSSQNYLEGYQYFVGFALAVGMGPNVTLHRIWIEKRVIWEGTANGNGQSIIIAKKDFFGGKGHGGGWIGKILFYSGNFNQPPDPYLRKSVPDMPGYGGTSYLVFRRNYIGESAFLRRMAFEISRYTDMLGLGGDSKIGEDMNPVEILAQVLTADWGCLNIPTHEIDLQSFVAAGKVVAAERNGMSIHFSRGLAGKRVVHEILRQIRATVYHDMTTGQITLKLVRDDYDPLAVPEITNAHVMEVSRISKNTWAETANQVRIAYFPRSNNYKESTAIAQDMANIEVQERLRSVTVSFPGVKEANLATKLAARELSYLSVPVAAIKLKTTYEVGTISPGDVFRFTYPEYGIENQLFRVTRYEMGTTVSDGATIEATQEVLASLNTVFAPPEKSLYTPVSPPKPEAPSGPYIMEAPRPFIDDKPSDTKLKPVRYMGFANTNDANQLAYGLQIKTLEGDRALYQQWAYLQQDLNPWEIQGKGFTLPPGFHEKYPDFFSNATDDEIRQGKNLMLIVGEGVEYIPDNVRDNVKGGFLKENVKKMLGGSEIIGYQKARVIDGDKVNLDVFRRGLMDTVPKFFKKNSRCYFLNSYSDVLIPAVNIGQNGIVQYKEDVKPKIVTYGLSEQLVTDYKDPVYLRHRAMLPYPPSDFETVIAGAYKGTYDPGQKVTLRWRYRSEFNKGISLPEDPGDTETFEGGKSELLCYIYSVRGKDDSLEQVTISNYAEHGLGRTAGDITLPDTLKTGDEIYILLQSQRVYSEKGSYPGTVFRSMDCAFVRGVIK